MVSRKIVAAATLSAGALFLGPVAMASAAPSADSGTTAPAQLSSGSSDTGSSSGSAGLSSGSATLDSGSSALDEGTSTIDNIITAITGIRDLSQPK
ncbi:hypothetical protein [Nocardia africana]|uniref:hypothetical protein n=1 Tax=Nocardia africana TaxID=134964 RepID=UPI0007A3E293|nr:hypothetical protein [Nocardia africana]MCC3313031.1 hypothetical protein [Nocardia africana]